MTEPFGSEQVHPQGCACGRHGLLLAESVVERAVLRAAFPRVAQRRRLLKALGGATVAAALAEVFPLGVARALAQDKPGALEKPNLKIGFIPITCASPIIMAAPMGFYSKRGLNVDVIKTAGWAIVRDKSMNREYDASHMLTPMPIALSLGLGSVQQAWQIPAIENINGQAIVLSTKMKDRRDPKTWKGMRFGIPFDYSMHNYLLRYYLAEAGIDPDADVQLRVIPPPEMVANLRADNIDGFLGPDPVNQRAVYDGIGFIHILSRNIWDGHPCCAFGVSKAFIADNPNTFLALSRAIVDATGYANKAENRKEIADAIAPANYLNQPPVVVEQALTGTFADGLGNIVRVPDRAGFDAFPWESFGVWMTDADAALGTAQGRGGLCRQVARHDVCWRPIAARVMRERRARRPPGASTKTFVVMGKPFDPAKAGEYLASFRDQAGDVARCALRGRRSSSFAILTIVLLAVWQFAVSGAGHDRAGDGSGIRQADGLVGDGGDSRPCRVRSAVISRSFSRNVVLTRSTIHGPNDKGLGIAAAVLARPGRGWAIGLAVSWWRSRCRVRDRHVAA